MNNYMLINYITWKKMDKLLETYYLLRLNHEELENLNRSTTSKETESVIKNFPQKKSSGPYRFTGEFCQTFKELISIVAKLFQKFEEERTLPN